MGQGQRGRYLLPSVCMAAALGALRPTAAFPAVYLVGPDQTLKTPSQAARVVHSGDTVRIEPRPGGYYDCAIWHADDLTIEGVGDDVRLTDTTCQGKAIFITVGNHITIRNLTFARARVPDMNGAGIRAEGMDLSVERSRFIDNESGILATDSAGSRITLKDSRFIQNGRCGPNRCSDAIAVGRVAELYVSNCEISGTKGGDGIRSLAKLSTLLDNRIEDGEDGSAAFLVELPWGGSLDMRRNALQRGPRGAGQGAAVRIMQGISAPPVETLVFGANTLRKDTRAPLTFVLNWTGTAARLSDNRLPPGATPASSSGYFWFLTKSVIHHSLAFAHDGLAIAKALARRIYHHL